MNITKIIKMFFDRLLLLRLDKLCFFIILINSINCRLEKKSTDYEQDYGIHNIADIILQSQRLNNQLENSTPNDLIKTKQISNPLMIKHFNQTNFRPSNWTGIDRLRKLKRLDDRLRKYREYRSKPEIRTGIYNTNHDYQFKRRSDLDDDYYYPTSYYPSNSHYTAHHLIYPPAVQPIISVPVTAPAIIPTSPPSAYYTTSRYRPSASRLHYHRVYPSVSTSNAIRRRLAAVASNPNYDAVPYHYPVASPSGHQSYYYGTGLAPVTPQQQSSVTYPSHAAYSATPILTGHSHEHDEHHDKEGREVHSLLPIITVIGIGAFMIPLLTTFFSAMMSSDVSCCQRQKERSSIGDVRESIYEQMKSVWMQVEKAINDG